MGERVTQSPQAQELARANRLRGALERGAPAGFVPPATEGSQPIDLETAASPVPPSKYFEQIFQNSPDPILLLDPSFRTHYVNREFQSMFGFSQEEILGASIDDLIFPP